MRAILFYEKQKFTQWSLWLLQLAVLSIPVYGVYKQILLGEQFGTRSMSDTGLVLYLLLVLAWLLLFWSMQLTTEIDKESIRVKFFPFVNKSINWSEIEEARMVDYGFVGWGIRLGTKYGTVYNIKGKIGVALKLKSGKKICIGTQKEDELNSLLHKAKQEQWM